MRGLYAWRIPCNKFHHLKCHICLRCIVSCNTLENIFGSCFYSNLSWHPFIFLPLNVNYSPHCVPIYSNFKCNQFGINSLSFKKTWLNKEVFVTFKWLDLFGSFFGTQVAEQVEICSLSTNCLFHKCSTIFFPSSVNRIHVTDFKLPEIAFISCPSFVCSSFNQ